MSDGLVRSKADRQAIAIIGMAGRFPGAETIDELWNNLIGGVDVVSEVGPLHDEVLERYQPAPKTAGTTYSKWGALLEGQDRFDAAFFHISPREAEMMDPQQRLLLESAWESLERAGYADGSLPPASGVFVGAMASEYLPNILDGYDRIAPHTITGNHSSVIANRLSYFLGLDGPSLTVDVACSSSLAALHLAVTSLRDGQCPFALVGATQAGLAPFHWVEFSQLGALSPTGRCRVYDRAADGYVMGEGVACLLLRPLHDALQAGDRILGVVRGVAVGHGGRTEGLTVPSSKAQARICRRALADASLSADEISYVEAHGTGTPLGDPVEIEGLTLAFRADTPRRQFCAIGSIKSNIGHLESAAGMAGLVKILQCFQHATLPANLHFHEPNPRIDFADSPFFLVEKHRPWDSDGARRAAIHASGFGGSIAFAILEEPPPIPVPSSPMDRNRHVVRVTAKSATALHAAAGRLVDFARRAPEQPLADIAHSMNVGRGLFEHRLCVSASSTAQLADRLQSFVQGRTDPRVHQGIAGQRPRVAFLFTGQGAQYADMARAIWESSPTFRLALDECAATLEERHSINLMEVLYGDSRSKIDETAWSQPALFAIECALSRLWTTWGIEPDVVLGHSLGEYAAAWKAGVFDLPTALSLVAERGKWMQDSPPGAMVAVFASETMTSELRQPFAGQLAIAAVNGPENVVVSGDEAVVVRFEGLLERAGVAHQRLNVRRAFHSPLMEVQATRFHQAISEITPSPPRLTWIANLTGQPWPADRAPSADDWRAHMLQPVHFEQSVREALALGVRVFLEIGPAPVLCGLGRRIASDVGVEAAWIPSLVRGCDDWETLCDAVARLDALGVPFDGRGFDADYRRRRIEPPTYPFDHKRYWIGRRTENTEHGTDRRKTMQEVLPLERVDWHTVDVPSTSPNAGLWIVFVDEGRRATQIVESLRSHGCIVAMASAGEEFEQPRAGEWTVRRGNVHDYRRLMTQVSSICVPSGIVHAFGIDVATRLPDEAAWDLAALSQAATDFERSPLHFAIAASGSASVHLAEEIDPAKAVLWGLARTLVHEYPLWNIGLFDVPIDSAIDPDTAAFVTASAGTRLVALRDGRWFEPIRRETCASNTPRRWNSNGVVLITGGLGGIGLAVAKEFARRGVRHLILASRGGVPAHAPSEAAIEALRQQGVDVETPRVNVAEERAVLDLIRAAKERFGRIAGIVHAAGVLSDGLIRSMTLEDFRRVFEAKVAGALHLARATHDVDLDFLVLCSSIVSLDGNVGQGAYAAANAAMDAIATNLRSRGRTATTIRWGPWSVGMGGQNALADAWSRLGLALIEEEAGARRLVDLCADPAGDYVVAPRTNDAQRTRPVPPCPSSPRQQGAVGGGPSAAGGDCEQTPCKGIRERLREIFGAALHLSPEQMDDETPFKEFGVDSILAEEALIRVRKEFGLSGLAVPVLFQHPTLRSLAAHLETLGARSESESRLGPVVHTRVGGMTQTDLGVESSRPRDIAVIGYAGRFPGADDTDAFWRNLINGTVHVGPPPAERWDLLRRYYPLSTSSYHDQQCPPPAPQPPGVPAPGERHQPPSPPHYLTGGWLTGIDLFDPYFFHMRPAEAERLDPRQRIFLEVAYRALEHAGYGGLRLAGTATGTFVGIGTQDYALLEQIPLAQINEATGVGCAPSVLASRLAYLLDFKGPSVPVDTACSSALVAVHLAMESLRSGQCDYALAGAVHLNLSAYVPIVLDRLGVVSHSGACRPFSADADGILPAEAAGAFLLRRLDDALASGDTIYAVLKGSAVNNDGRTNGIAAPNPLAQMDVIRKAWKDAEMTGDSVSYLEAHATGTCLGDPIEVEGIAAAFGPASAKRPPCWIGSVKSNIGHADIAAGAVGLIKVIESLQRRTLPATANVGEANPKIDVSNGPLRLCERAMSWDGPRPLRAGISAFGFSGTNAHVVVEEAPRRIEAALGEGQQLCLFSARSRELLIPYVRQMRDHLDSSPALSIADVAFTLAVGRMHQRHRLAVVCASTRELSDRLTHWLASSGAREIRGVACIDSEEPGSSSWITAATGIDEAMRTAGSSWLAGEDVDWQAIYHGRNVHPVALPGSPMERIRCWFQSDRPTLSQRMQDVEFRQDLFWRRDWQAVDLPVPPGAQGISWHCMGDDAAPSASVRDGSIPEGAHSVLWIAREDSVRDCQAAIEQCAAWARWIRRRHIARFALVTIGSRADSLPTLAALQAATRVLAKEEPDCNISIYDVENWDDLASRNAVLAQLRVNPPAGEFRVREGRLSSPVAFPFVPTVDTSPLRPGATYLITGAAGGLGRALAEWLAREYQARLALVHRKVRDRSAWEKRLDSAGVERIHLEADVADAVAVQAVMRTARSVYGRIDGVFHLAGRGEHRRLREMSPEDIRMVVRGKVAGAIALDDATRDDPPDLFVLFSSIAGVEGNIFQGAYSAANAWLDAFAQWRSQQGRPTTCIDWGLVSGVGMGAELASRSTPGDRDSLRIDEAFDAMRVALASGEKRIIVSPRRPELGFPKRATGESPSDVLERLKAEMAVTLDVPIDVLDARTSFVDFGMDSKLAVEFVRRIERLVGSRLSATLPFDYPNLSALAGYVSSLPRTSQMVWPAEAANGSTNVPMEWTLSTGRPVRVLARSH